jgi:hypothetical protein
VGGSPTRSACASSRRTTAASQRMLQQLQQLYHTRDAAMSTAECIQVSWAVTPDVGCLHSCGQSGLGFTHVCLAVLLAAGHDVC